MKRFAAGIACEVGRVGAARQRRRAVERRASSAKRWDAFDRLRSDPRHRWSADGQRNCILYIAANAENSLFCRRSGKPGCCHPSR